MDRVKVLMAAEVGALDVVASRAEVQAAVASQVAEAASAEAAALAAVDLCRSRRCPAYFPIMAFLTLSGCIRISAKAAITNVSLRTK